MTDALGIAADPRLVHRPISEGVSDHRRDEASDRNWGTVRTGDAPYRPYVAHGDPTRPEPRLSFHPAECNPVHLFERLLLGHRTEFSWERLIRHLDHDLWERTYGPLRIDAGPVEADRDGLQLSPAEA